MKYAWTKKKITDLTRYRLVCLQAPTKKALIWLIYTFPIFLHHVQAFSFLSLLFSHFEPETRKLKRKLHWLLPEYETFSQNTQNWVCIFGIFFLFSIQVRIKMLMRRSQRPSSSSQMFECYVHFEYPTTPLELRWKGIVSTKWSGRAIWIVEIQQIDFPQAIRENTFCLGLCTVMSARSKQNSRTAKSLTNFQK